MALRRRASSFPLTSLSLHWLLNLTRAANKPDENLGQADVGRSLCRIVATSTGKLMEEFRRIDSYYGRPPDTFIDLGCGRGLVCAGALLEVAQLSQVIGWDINDREIAWARKHILQGAGDLSLQAKLSFEVGNAVEFCLDRDAVCIPALGVGVWVYAFWKDWGEDRARVARHLFLEDSHLWTVFACSDRSEALFSLIADGNETMLEMLRDNFVQASSVVVHLSGSRESHSIYFYVKK